MLFVLIPVLFVVSLFIAASFTPFLWRRGFWGPRRMMHRPLVHHHRYMHRPHHRHW